VHPGCRRGLSGKTKEWLWANFKLSENVSRDVEINERTGTTRFSKVLFYNISCIAKNIKLQLKVVSRGMLI